METTFLGVPNVDAFLFFCLTLFAAFSAFIGITTGTVGGLLMMVVLASLFPPTASIPIHTVVQLGGNLNRTFLLWRYLIRNLIPPFLIGAIIGVFAGAQIFISLPTAILQGLLGIMMIIFTWIPTIGQFGSTRNRFAILGFFGTFLGMFVSATGGIIAPFVASVSPDRRNHVATFSVLMVIVHFFKLLAFGMLGVTMAPYLPLMLAMLASASIAIYFGNKILHKMREKNFRIIFKVTITILAIRLIWRAINEYDLFF